MAMESVDHVVKAAKEYIQQGGDKPFDASTIDGAGFGQRYGRATSKTEAFRENGNAFVGEAQDKASALETLLETSDANAELRDELSKLSGADRSSRRVIKNILKDHEKEITRDSKALEKDMATALRGHQESYAALLKGETDVLSKIGKEHAQVLKAAADAPAEEKKAIMERFTEVRNEVRETFRNRRETHKEAIEELSSLHADLQESGAKFTKKLNFDVIKSSSVEAAEKAGESTVAKAEEHAAEAAGKGMPGFAKWGLLGGGAYVAASEASKDAEERSTLKMLAGAGAAAIGLGSILKGRQAAAMMQGAEKAAGHVL